MQRLDTPMEAMPAPIPASSALASNRPAPRGWCPGALRPMMTGDGLLVRLRLTGGVLDIARARAIAACATQFGNGQIDLSARANLQLRGVREAALPDLTDELQRLSLLDDSAEAETVRNVIASPFTGLDHSAVLDIQPVTAALEARLVHDMTLHALPGKFGFLIDDGGALPLADVNADIRFTAIATPNGPRFVIALGGAEHTPIGTCEPADLADRAARLAQAFLALRDAASARRMRDLVRSLGAAAIAHAAGLAMQAVSTPARAFDISDVIGHHTIDGANYVGVAAPFGRMRSDALDHLGIVAAQHGATGLRLTPWRAILIAGISSDAAEAILAELRGERFILDAADARLHVAACAGMPACTNATTPVQVDAERFSRLFAQAAPAATALHVSGCAKGCAHPSSAPFTLVGNDGLYDLIENGRAADHPVANFLTSEQVEAELVRRLSAPKERLLAKLP